MISAIVGVGIGFVVGYFTGARNRKHKIVQIGGDGSYQVGIVNNVTEEDDYAKLPVW